jgi:hypothetical protein
MKVTAIKRGFYGVLREPGDQFDVKDGEKGSWFAPVKEAERTQERSEQDGKSEVGKEEEREGVQVAPAADADQPPEDGGLIGAAKAMFKGGKGK